MIGDLAHLVLLVAGIAFATWSLVVFRRRLPRGRFIIFGAASAATLFGCAAVGGEVGLMSQSAWFAIVIAFLGGLAVAGYATARHSPIWR